MAGDWIKFECNLPEKPEVLAIAASLGLDDPDAAVGKLMRLFRWFDQHTTDGNAARVTPALLDRAIGVPGLSLAVMEAGWLHQEVSGLRLEKFARHNGATAKARAQTAKRVANHRSNADGNGPSNGASVTPPLAREDKEKNSPSLRSGETRAARLPKPFELPDDWRQFCVTERPDLDPDRVAAKFADHWHAKPGKAGTKLDWQATWRNWVRDERPSTIRTSTPAAQSFAASDRETGMQRWEQMTGRTHPDRGQSATVIDAPPPLSIGAPA